MNKLVEKLGADAGLKIAKYGLLILTGVLGTGTAVIDGVIKTNAIERAAANGLTHVVNNIYKTGDK